jgi:predicted RNA binding protein YcfA (HicA-like mRNA interferase family)
MKVRIVIKIIQQDGWIQIRQKGSHRQFKHLIKKGCVTIAGNLNDDVPKGTLGSILKQAQIKNND